jgi:hypothetical protein
MRDSWGHVNLVACVTAWSNRNHYSLVVVGATAERSLWNQDFIPSVDERFHPQRDLAKGSYTKVRETMRMLCGQVFPCKVYSYSNLHDTLGYG